MEKTKLGARAYLFPLPVVLAGANVAGKPNFLTIGLCGIINLSPPMIHLALRQNRYTSIGIRENGTFSVNTCSEAMMTATDYCGIYSGSQVDKSTVFEVFYGGLETAPMIVESPVNLECRLSQVLDLGGVHEVFIGEVVESYAAEEYLTDGQPDLDKIKPIVYCMPEGAYRGLTGITGRAHAVGKDFRK